MPTTEMEQVTLFIYKLLKLGGINRVSIKHLILRTHNSTITLSRHRRTTQLFRISFEAELAVTVSPTDTQSYAENITLAVKKAGGLSALSIFTRADTKLFADTVSVAVKVSPDTIPETTTTAAACSEGFSIDHHSNTCVDIDECSSLPNSGDTITEDDVLNNSNGTVQSDGNDYAFGPLPNNSSLPSTTNGVCHEETQDCVNSDGSFSCVCRAGWQDDPAAGACVDVNECTVAAVKGTAVCHEKGMCDNTNGSFTCTCEPGWKGTGFECNDINECLSKDSPCPIDTSCDNAPGSFICKCLAGFELVDGRCIDIDECFRDTHTCSQNARCTNTGGSFTCKCTDGWFGDGVSCSDIDECNQADLIDCNGRHFSDADCRALYHNNQPGTCAQLLDDWHNDGTCDVSKPSLFCTELGCDGTDCLGFQSRGGCTLSTAGAHLRVSGTERCGKNQTCVNFDGGYGCSPVNISKHNHTTPTTRPEELDNTEAAKTHDDGKEGVLLVTIGVLLASVFTLTMLAVGWKRCNSGFSWNDDRIHPRRGSSRASSIYSTMGQRTPSSSISNAKRLSISSTTHGDSIISRARLSRSGVLPPIATSVSMTDMADNMQVTQATLTGLGVPQSRSFGSDVSSAAGSTTSLQEQRNNMLLADNLRRTSQLLTSPANPSNISTPKFPAPPPVITQVTYTTATAPQHDAAGNNAAKKNAANNNAAKWARRFTETSSQFQPIHIRTTTKL